MSPSDGYIFRTISCLQPFLGKNKGPAADCLQRPLVSRMTEAILPLRYTDNARYVDRGRCGR